MNHEYFMGLALAEAGKALAAGEFPVGCVLVANDEVVGVGRRENSKTDTANELDHAEIVALRTLLSSRPELERREIVVYSTMEPCLMCYATLLLNGIRTIVYAYEDAMGGGTCLPLDSLTPLYREMADEIEIIARVRRQESLALFVDFFKNPANDYWRDSLLAEYTLGQS
ncbi:MAG: nucleoside deaminase [Desulfobulbaceae bacterium]|nr:nucleoside deaminase [Desulfobulbaceae bacterium]HIJ77767.1 nucleoside deaminase [Deltaproteobacteria bacterium]